jgi:hypothetical protein
VQLLSVLHIEYADIGPFAHNAPYMEPLALSLQRFGAFNFSSAESFDLLRIDVMRNPDDYFYVAEQDISLERRHGRIVEGRTALVSAGHHFREGGQPRMSNLVLRGLGSSASKGLHKTPSYFVVGRRILTGD